jgi:hypothetical protein
VLHASERKRRKSLTIAGNNLQSPAGLTFGRDRSRFFAQMSVWSGSGSVSGLKKVVCFFPGLSVFFKRNFFLSLVRPCYRYVNIGFRLSRFLTICPLSCHFSDFFACFFCMFFLQVFFALPKVLLHSFSNIDMAQQNINFD